LTRYFLRLAHTDLMVPLTLRSNVRTAGQGDFDWAGLKTSASLCWAFMGEGRRGPSWFCSGMAVHPVSTFGGDPDYHFNLFFRGVIVSAGTTHPEGSFEKNCV